jgi:eukaryotic-like serine/threonine-protein kinase
MKPLEPGDTLDHYRLEATVARSGMSTLFRATDLRDGRQVAIKVPHAEMEADPVLVARFEREQEIGQELDHPGVVKTFAGEERSRLYMVIEWVDGRLLRTVLNEEKKLPKKMLPITRATSFAVQICDALDTMHTHGVVHRDLKPENVMVDDHDRIKLIDFGIALKEDARRLTHVEVTPMLGTPDYIAPEQVEGRRGDQRSDIYSLGIVFYEMLTGQVPFSGPNPLVVMNERTVHDPEPARSLRPEITAELQEILDRALERDPRRRYSTAADMAWELEHQEQVGVNLGTRPDLRKRMPLDKRRAMLYAGLALLPAAIFGLMVLMARR